MMTGPDDARRSEGEESMSAQDRLRAVLLTSGLYDWVSLAEVTTAINHYRLAETLPAQQDLALRTIRSLLEDGLMQIGDLPSKGSSSLDAWDLTIDAAMEHAHNRFVRHYDDAMWEFTIWLGPTDAGKRVARELEGKTAD